MGSYLKRISPVSKLHNSNHKLNSQIYFDLDEPDFLLKRKFYSNPSTQKSSVKSHQYLNYNHAIICPKCHNTEFSNSAKFCKICGSDISSE